MSGRLVAATIITFCIPSTPSHSTSNWLKILSCAPAPPPSDPLFPASASISSCEVIKKCCKNCLKFLVCDEVVWLQLVVAVGCCCYCPWQLVVGATLTKKTIAGAAALALRNVSRMAASEPPTYLLRSCRSKETNTTIAKEHAVSRCDELCSWCQDIKW